MKISVNWIKEYIDFELPPIDELVTKIGAQLGAVEEVIDIGAKYRGVVVAKVVSCEKHPNADKLSVCTIDDGGITPDVNRGEDGLVQVVCGAPNVRQGLFVAWVPPKAIVPSTYDTDPFTLEARELRGIVSNGMLASGKELELNDSHDGILEIDEDVQPGQALAEVYKLNDHIIDIENKMFTHRPDCFGQLGVAREIAGILGHKFTSPDWYRSLPEGVLEVVGESLALEVRNEVPELAPRFMTVAMSDVEVKPSPLWMQSYLSRVGIRPINNIVDITNYMMMLTAQPLHAYDYDKVKAIDGSETATLVVRKPHQGEKLTLLGGKEVEPRPEAILIASATKPIAIGGVMGGADTEVDENTKNIILECANFDMYSIRRTSMAHGLFTDAVTRFNKGQSKTQNNVVQHEAIKLLQNLAGGHVASEVIDIAQEPFAQLTHQYEGEGIYTFETDKEVFRMPFEFISSRLGVDLEPGQICMMLRNVEIIANPYDDTNKELEVVAPFWRTDIEIPEDIVEEIGRLHGFDKLTLELPQRSTAPTQRNTMMEVKTKIRSTLSQAGANEVSTYSFVHGNLFGKIGQDKARAFRLGNALSPDLQYYRLSLTPSLLEKVHPNIKTGYTDGFALFEIGKAHIIGEQDRQKSDLPMEYNSLSFVYAAQRGDGAAYYVAQKYLRYLLEECKVKSVTYKPLASVEIDKNSWAAQVVAPFDPKRSVLVLDSSGIIWGVLGEYKSSVRKILKLSEYTAGFEIGPLLLSRAAKEGMYTPLSRFPGITQDITVSVPSTTPYTEVRQWVEQYLSEHQVAHTKISIVDKDIYQKSSQDPRKHLTFSVSVVHYEKTLRESEVTQLIEGLATAASQQYS